jgi:Amino acid permease
VPLADISVQATEVQENFIALHPCKIRAQFGWKTNDEPATALLCAEIPFTCGRDGTFPKWFGIKNENGSPANALLATTVFIQLFLILIFFSKNAYQFFYFIASVAILPPYVLSGALFAYSNCGPANASVAAFCRDG